MATCRRIALFYPLYGNGIRQLKTGSAIRTEHVSRSPGGNSSQRAAALPRHRQSSGVVMQIQHRVLPVRAVLQSSTGVGQLDGQLHVRGLQGAQLACGFHAPGGRMQVRPVHRWVPALLQHSLNIPRGHRSWTFRIESDQNNHHTSLQR